MGAPKLGSEPKLNLVGIEIPSSEETEQYTEKSVLSDLQKIMKELREGEVKSLFEEGDPWATQQEEVLPTVKKPPPQETPERVKLLRAQEIAKTHRELLRLMRSSLWLKIFIPKAIKTFLSEAYRTIPLPALEQAHQVTLRHSLLCRKVDSLGWIRRRFIRQFYGKLCTELGLERKEIGEGLHCS